MAWLEPQPFAPSTVKGYLMGASALTKALRWASVRPVKMDDMYQPFKLVTPTPPRRPLRQAAEGAVEAIESPLLRAKLRVLFALLMLGLDGARGLHAHLGEPLARGASALRL